MTIMPKDSDVILQVADGVHGILLGNIHTDLSKFAHLVKDTECIVSPVCDLHVKFTKGSKQNRKPFRLLIPHIMKEDLELEEEIRIQIFEHSKSDPLSAHPFREDEDDTFCPAREQEATFTWPLKNVRPLFCVRRNHEEFACDHFCQILISAEAAGCCCQKANLLVFSRIDPPNEYTSLPIVSMAIYLTSLWTNMEDFYKVEWHLTKHLSA